MERYWDSRNNHHFDLIIGNYSKKYTISSVKKKKYERYLSIKAQPKHLSMSAKENNANIIMMLAKRFLK